MRKIKIVIFDLDGTLVNAYKAVSRSMNYALNRLSLKPLDDITIQRSVGWGETRLVRSLVEEKYVAQMLKVYRNHHRESLKTGTTFLPGAKKLLVKLKKEGYVLAIASNRPTRFTKIILKVLNMNQYFDKVLCADKVKKGKPAPYLLKETIDAFSFFPSEAIYVGDMTIDAIAARRARMKSIIVTTGSSTSQEIRGEKPYQMISRLDELTAILDKLNRFAVKKRKKS